MSFGITAAVVGGGLITSVIGGSMQASADAAAARKRQEALDRFTVLQGQEFDVRQGIQDASRARIAALKNRAFADQTQLSTKNLAERLATRAKFNNIGSHHQQMALIKKGEINDARNVLRDASFLEQGAASDAEVARQEGFQAEGTGVANRVLARMKAGSAVDGADAGTFLGDVNAATARRGQAITSAEGAPAATMPGVEGYGAADLAKRVTERVGMAQARALKGGQAAAYGDALSIAARVMGRANERADILARKATDSRAALDPEIAAAKKVREIADQDAETRKQNAQADVDNYMEVLNKEKDLETSRTEGRQQAIEDLLSKFYTGEIQTEQDFNDALVNSSLSYEDALQALTNAQMSGTYGRSTFGQILSGAGSSLISAGISRGLR